MDWLIDWLIDWLQTFLGNSDRTTVVKHFFSPDIWVFARGIRFHPKTWAGHIAMRVEIYGCREGETIDVLYSSSIVSLSPQWSFTIFNATPFYSIKRMSTLGFDSMDRAQRAKKTLAAQFLPVQSPCLVRLQVIITQMKMLRKPWKTSQISNSDWEPIRHMLTFHVKQNGRARELKKKKRDRCVKEKILRDHSGDCLV